MALLQVYTNIPEDASQVPAWRVGPIAEGTPQTAMFSREDAVVVADNFLTHVLDSLARIHGIDYVYGGVGQLLQGTTDPVWTYYHDLVLKLRGMDSHTRRATCVNLLSKMHTIEKSRFDAALTALGFTLDLATGKMKRLR